LAIVSTNLQKIFNLVHGAFLTVM